ncbi:MAG: DUF1902 domain-containing protein [Rhodoferax sp.]|uniref:DUF1902 domain-containing protein n=1 Tax=Rhodoferax sp. TaxID=50421 RepID=UPI002638D74A|nr:DUF1902 domain-containing protein [Rhodoferax sp.]MDD2882951.1 DUF1902 domain-containing protein [Rhodoferax sp.]
MKQQFLVQAIWDSDVQVWSAYSDDVPGLVTESDTLEALATKLEKMVPELLELNGRLSLEELPGIKAITVTVTDELEAKTQPVPACLVVKVHMQPATDMA